MNATAHRHRQRSQRQSADDHRDVGVVDGDVTYTYLPACPTVSGIGRIGVHHQRTLLVVTFDGPVDLAKAEDPGNYTVITRSGKKIPIKSATFNPATNAGDRDPRAFGSTCTTTSGSRSWCRARMNRPPTPWSFRSAANSP